MMKKRKSTMYMRQLMQLSVALMFLMPSAALASGSAFESTVADNSVKVEKKSTVADVRTITGTVYDAATNQPMAGVRVQATGHKRVTTMTDGEGKYKLNVPSYATLITFSTPDYLLVQKPVGKKDIINVHKPKLQAFHRPKRWRLPNSKCSFGIQAL